MNYSMKDSQGSRLTEVLVVCLYLSNDKGGIGIFLVCFRPSHFIRVKLPN